MMKGGYGTNVNRKSLKNVYLLTLILSLVFGGAVLGLMRTLKLRDRIFDNLIKEKQTQILSLQLHLQNEREHVQDGKLKADELKMKVYGLRAQKKELHGKILEMQSAMLSLKEEQKMLESAYEEQQNETKLLRDKCSQNPQLESLTELLRQKEAEIDKLQRQIQLPGTGSSVNKDNPSIFPAKINVPGSKEESGENPIDIERRTENDTSTIEETKSSIQTGDKSEDGKFTEHRKTVLGRRSGHVYDLQSEIESKKNSTEMEMTEEVSDGKEIKTVHRGGVKPEVRDNGRNSLRGNYGYIKRPKGKRLRAIQQDIKRKGNFGSDEAKITMTDQRFEKHDKRANSKAYARGITREIIEDSPLSNNRLQSNINQIKTEYISKNEATEVKEENRQQGILAHSSAVKSNGSINELQHYKTEGKNSGSFNDQEDSMIRHHIEKENDNVNYDSPGIKSEVNKNQDDANTRNSEESEIVAGGSREFEYDVQKNSEEEAHTNEPELKL